MSPDQSTPEQLAAQLAENSMALIQADLALRATQQQHRDELQLHKLQLHELQAIQQRSNELLQQFQEQRDVDRRFERRVLVGIFAIVITAGGILHLLYPDFLPEQIVSIESFFRHL